ncbi:D-alanyl-D-alanine carboxypeptidase [Klenkia marina]|uniref:D-alanyl-D-alanine carboxypeptidase n=1 Tax=Klenkia marina TaxID=1960309 RepID=A0A1G4XXJ9_9ACTN|nr:M15 family metallopeptidase [Klenkia marina]SCX45937.1 D-alanyl-D-alanine carboxypeptidase [Klenkia marina]
MPIRRRTPALLLSCLALAACATTAVVAQEPSPTLTTPDGVVLGPDDGFLPDGEHLSPHDTGQPAVANLERALLDAVQDAADAAAAEGIDVQITSGWRSAALQQALFDQAVVEHGSVEEAQRFVLSPELSQHVTGRAVDIAPYDAMDWLSRFGDDYGLCRTYANEAWHFELVTSRGGECPEPLADATAG